MFDFYLGSGVDPDIPEKGELAKQLLKNTAKIKFVETHYSI